MDLKRYVTVTVLITLLSFVISTQAGLTFYTDRSVWEAAVNGDIVTENFNAVAPSFFAEGVNNTGLIDIELVNISQTNEYNSIDDDLFILDIDGTPFFRGGCLRADPDAMINLVLPSSVKAFGGDFSSTNSVDGLWLQVNGLQYAFSDQMSSDDGTGFLGFISTSVFTTVTLFDPVKDDKANKVYRFGESFGLDNVSFSEVPEPMTMALMGVGGLLLRKRK